MTLLDVRDRLNAMGVLGMNHRNALYIGPLNPRRAYPTVDNKQLTKQLAVRHGIPTPTLYEVLASHRRLRDLPRLASAWPEFVVKPSRGAAGNGILLVVGHDASGVTKPSGERLTWDELIYHVACILSGIHSLEGLEDEALFEAYVRVDATFEAVTYRGVPDIRVIVYRGVPAMAMVRLPTQASDGRANLHQGAIGAGIDIGPGTTRAAVRGRQVVATHPDTGRPVAGISVPGWDRILEIAARGLEMTGLGYLGADLVLDRTRGPLLLELNARPGLAIQLANQDGLRRRLDLIDRHWRPELTPANRVTLARTLFA
jgi:alpha-L-glutamate ligase-like protein